MATNPGVTKGKATRVKAPQYEQPSISAASSNSAGSSSKAWLARDRYWNPPLVAAIPRSALIFSS